MTIVSSFGIGGVACIISGDTKQASQANVLFNLDLELGDLDTKVHKISNNFIAAGGGYNEIYEFVIKHLQAKNYNTAKDIVAELKRLEKIIPVEFDDIYQLYETDAFYAVQIMGFDNNDGKLYSIGLGQEVGVTCVTAPPNEIGGSVISPGDFSPALERTGDLSELIANIDNPISVVGDLIDFTKKLQYELIKDYPDEISKTHCYYALVPSPEGVLHFEEKSELE